MTLFSSARACLPTPSNARGLFALGLFSALLTACPQNLDNTDAGSEPEPEPGPQTCESVEDCPNNVDYDCLGVCLMVCGADAACPLDEYCSPRGYCEVGCRNSDTCDTDLVCVSGSCVSTESAGSCGTKCDCDVGQICVGGACQDPPATCAGPADCGRGPGDRCEAYQCNGFTQACFDPDPQPCVNAADCTGRPGCTSGTVCACTPNGQCVPDTGCTIPDEAADCGSGFYCNADLVCDALPACTGEAQCTSLGLTCNLGVGACERSVPCTGDNECTTAPATYCNLAAAPAACAVPTCNNGGVTCAGTDECNAFGVCVPQGSGVGCNGNLDCGGAAWPSTEYCEFASGTGDCTPGCYSNTNCGSGDVCNSSRECVLGGGGGTPGGLAQWGDTCQPGGCQVGLLCGLFSSTCQETCTSGCTPGTDCCLLSGASDCVDLFGAFCR